MEKVKLINARKRKGLSQEEISIMMGMDQATYCRKEKGNTKITAREWKKVATILDVNLSEIYEDDDSSIIISNDNSPNSNILSDNNNYCNVPEYILESLKKYIEKLEAENSILNEQVSELSLKLKNAV